MIIYLYRCLVLIFISFILPQNHILFDFDPIENNQYIVSSYNLDVLDTLNYKSIVFNQSHHIPFGAYLFKDLSFLNQSDSTEVLTQLILKRGDFSFRDLIVSMYLKNERNVSFRYAGNVRSFTPLSISSVSGETFLQNHMIDISKTSNTSYFNTIIMFHDQNPTVPFTYYSETFNNETDVVYNTRECKSLLWGALYQNKIGEKLTLGLKSSNHYSKHLQYKNSIQSEDSILEFDNSYITIFNILSLAYQFSGPELHMNYSSKSSNFSSNIDGDFNSRHNFFVADLRFNKEKFSAIFGFSYSRLFSGDEFLIYDYNQQDPDDPSSFIEPSTLSSDATTNSKRYINPRINIEYNLNSYFSLSASLEDKLGVYEYKYDDLYYRNNIKSLHSHVQLLSKYKSNHLALSLGDNNAGNSYLGLIFSHKTSFFSVSLESRSFFGGFIMKDFYRYELTLNMPFKSRGFNSIINIQGRTLDMLGGFYVRNYPTLNRLSDSDFPEDVYNYRMGYTDISLGLEFNKFLITYHNITSNGNHFSAPYPYSDMGTSFVLPEYSIFGNSISIFHYFRVSWTFID